MSPGLRPGQARWLQEMWTGVAVIYAGLAIVALVFGLYVWTVVDAAIGVLALTRANQYGKQVK